MAAKKCNKITEICPVLCTTDYSNILKTLYIVNLFINSDEG